MNMRKVVAGSPTLVRSLLLQDLLDELTLMIHPVIAGRGKRLFAGESDLKRLKLVGSQITSTGVVLLTYTSLKENQVKPEVEASLAGVYAS